MNLYLIAQSENTDYDTYDCAVVAAESEDIARKMYPSDGSTDWSIYSKSAWVDSPDKVGCVLLGIAMPFTKRGVICSSFNAG